MAFGMSSAPCFGPTLPRHSLSSKISEPWPWAANFTDMVTKFQIVVVVEVLQPLLYFHDQFTSFEKGHHKPYLARREEGCFSPFPMSHQHKALGSPCLSHLRRQRVSTMYHGSFISLYLCLQMLIMSAGAFHVQGPHEPLVAMLGGDAELPCFLLPSQNVKNMEISWTRFLPSHLVHLYEDGRDKPEEAMEKYLGRTELVKNVMHKGMVVLKILNVQPSDKGQYRCAFKNDSFYSDTVIDLKVAALGSHPQLLVEVTESRQLRLECKSEGWFPQPKAQWMESEGREIIAESETHTQDKGGLFHVTASLLLRETSQKNLTCSVWNPVLNQKKEEQFSIAGQFSLSPHCAPTNSRSECQHSQVLVKALFQVVTANASVCLHMAEGIESSR
ncbi:hypothetical protein QTO34_003974, partial [Cnephaeus nilssonii]